MKKDSIVIGAIAFSLVLMTAAPSYAQLGVGVGVGAQTGVGVRGAGVGVGTQTGVGVQAGGTQVGVGSDLGVDARAASQAKAGDVSSSIESNPQLSSRVQSMLPDGSSISSASAGFKNQGQFLSALHASQNLDIPFDQLKAKMTGSSATSLESAIRAAKPDMSEKQAKQEAKKAETEAKARASAKASAAATAAAKRPSQQ